MEDSSRKRQIIRYEALIARDVIDLAERYPAERVVLETVSEVCFNLVQMFGVLGHSKTAIDWLALYDVYDSQVGSLLHGLPPGSTTKAREVYEVASRIIAAPPE